MEKPIENQKIIFSEIKYSDQRFLQVDNQKINWFNHNGSLGFSTGNDALLLVKVKPQSYLPALWVTLASWFLVAGIAAFHYHMKKQKIGEITIPEIK